MGILSISPPKPWSWPVGVAVTAVAIHAAYWLRFGYVDGYAIAFTAFLILLELADGRTLSRSPKVTLHVGSANVLVLRGIGRIIDEAPDRAP
jgi:hypothetical protein